MSGLRRGMSLKEELAERARIIASLNSPAPASTFVHQLESRRRRRLSSQQFLASLAGFGPMTSEEFVTRLDRRGTSPVPIRDVPAHVLLDDPAARDRFIAEMNAREGRAAPHKTSAASVSSRRTGIRGLVRMPVRAATRSVIALRSAASDSDGASILEGHFAVFNEWTEIDSWFEGHFMESIAPGAFSKTFRENRDNMRVLFQHGRDPQLGDKPLGPIETLEQDDIGARYVVPLLATSYNSDLIPGLRANLYGASFRFNVVKESTNNKPAKSTYNPDAIPERVIREMRVMEFGPVTFPAYVSATAGLRSCMVGLSDEFLEGTAA